MQPSQSVRDPGLPDCPVCQPQAPAPQVRQGAGRCSPAGGTGGTPSLTGDSRQRESRCLCVCFFMLFGACTPAMVLKHRFAKNINIFPFFKQLDLPLSPQLRRGSENPFAVITGTVPPPPPMTPGSRRRVAEKTGAEAIVFWLPPTSVLW